MRKILATREDRSYIDLLKISAKKKDKPKGTCIHRNIQKRGLLEKSPYLASALINMYAKCGALAKAQQVLEELSTRDVITWNALIAGYVQQGQGHEALNCFEQMQSEGLIPNSVTFVCILKSCSKNRDIKNGKKIHEMVEDTDLMEKDVMIGTALVDMYAKCGMLSKAHDVLEQFTTRNVVSWNALISGYVEWNDFHKAMNCFEQMKCEGFIPDAVTLICILNACKNICMIDKGKRIHSDIVSRNFLKKNAILGNALADMYAKCSSLMKAQEVLEGLPDQDVISWNVLISGYSHEGKGHEALVFFEQMRHEGVFPNEATMICILKVCGNIRGLEKGKQIHSKILSSGLLEKKMDLANALLDMYIKCFAFARARELIEEFLVWDSVSWNALILACTQQDQAFEALCCFTQMQSEGLFPDLVTFICLTKACGNTEAISRVSFVYEELRKQSEIIFMGEHQNSKNDNNQNHKEKLVSLHHYFAKMYSCKVSINVLKWKLFETRPCIKDKDSLSQVSPQLPKHYLMSDSGPWNALITSYAHEGYDHDVLCCFEHMHRQGLSPNPVTFVCLLQACGRTATIEKGKKIHKEIWNRGLLEKDVVLGTALVDMYVKCGELSEAAKVVEELPVRDTFSWCALISGYARQGQFQEALFYFEMMQIEGLVPDAIIFTSILKACGMTGILDKGKRIHKEIIDRGMLEKDILLGNSLVDMYAKCGALEKAREVMEELPVHDGNSWHVLIAGYIHQGLPYDALTCFRCMENENLYPDINTLTCILNICGRIGAIDEGMEIHKMISARGLLGKDIVLGAALVDMYTKCGIFTRAYQVLQELPMRDIVSWSTLISGYVQEGQFDHALRCFEQMQSEGLSPDEITFSSILKACTSKRALEKGKQIHKKVAEMGLLEKDVVLCTALVDMYAKCGGVTKAVTLLEQFSVQHVVSWNSLISGLVEQDRCHEALNLFQQMQDKGVSPDAVTFISILSACGHTGAIEKGKEIHVEIICGGLLENNIVLGTSLVDMYAKCGMLAKAHEVLDELPVRNIVSWNAIIAQYAQEGRHYETLNCFKQVLCEGLSPDGVTFLCVLNACNRTGNVDEARAFFGDMTEKYKVTPNVQHYTCMVVILGSAGSFDEVLSVIQVMPSFEHPEVWVALLVACRKWENVVLGILVFDQLMQLDSRSAATYILMTSIFAATGMQADAKKVEEMKLKHAQ